MQNDTTISDMIDLGFRVYRIRTLKKKIPIDLKIFRLEEYPGLIFVKTKQQKWNSKK